MSDATYPDYLSLRRGSAPPPDPHAEGVRVYSDSDGALRSLQSDGTDAPIGGGAAPAGVAIVRGPYAVGFADLVALRDGVAFYTPAVGEVLLDAWFVVDTVFNDVAQADISQYNGSSPDEGLWEWQSPINLAAGADSPDQGGGPPGNGIPQNVSLATVAVSANGGGGRVVPAVFTNTDPLLVVVSQDGTKGGSTSPATDGAARLYIVTADPVAFA